MKMLYPLIHEVASTERTAGPPSTGEKVVFNKVAQHVVLKHSSDAL